MTISAYVGRPVKVGLEPRAHGRSLLVLTLGALAAMTLAEGCDAPSSLDAGIDARDAAMGAAGASGSGAGAGDQATAGQGGAAGHGSLHPPSNINLSSCASVLEDDQTDGAACTICCTAQGFSMSRFYGGACVCGNPMDGAGATVCSAQNASADVCDACCTGANYAGANWDGSCACDTKTDVTVCPSSPADTAPDASCDSCCLNHGYIGDIYSDFPASVCNCIDGI
jgi:hypothetical protein